MRLMDRQFDSLETGVLIDAVLRAVPGSYVRDHREIGGWIAVMRGSRPIYDASRNTAEEWPAETLLSLPAERVTKKDLVAGIAIKRPGWQRQIRRLGELISPLQAKLIEKQLRRPIFREAEPNFHPSHSPLR